MSRKKQGLDWVFLENTLIGCNTPQRVVLTNELITGPSADYAKNIRKAL
ncbi:hypothetical protein [Bacillus sp. FJAT-27245]|nr:hypothetical protein [Bacillus sp. FJAT-27245]